MNFVAGNAMCNCLLVDAKKFLATVAAEPDGPQDGELFACPVAGAGTNAGGLVPEAQFEAQGVPLDTPAYFMCQFPNNAKYPSTYTVGISLWRIKNQKADPLSTLA